MKDKQVQLFGYQKIILIMRRPKDFTMFNMPALNNVRIILTGYDAKNPDINILLESEDETEEKIYRNLGQQYKNFKLYLNLYSDNTIDAVLHDSPEIFSDKNEFEKKILNSLDALRDEKLPHYLNERTTQQHILLQTALNELQAYEMFNAFPKLINWLDDNDGKGSSRFCSIRDSCEHGTLDKQRALKKVNEKFPGEFEFEDDILKRNSQKNIISMEKYLPEVLDHIKRIFKNKYVK